MEEERLQAVRLQPPVGLLRGRRAVVTAAAGAGIGFAVAERFCQEGAEVVVSDVHEARLEKAAERLRAGGAIVHAVPCDVRDTEQVDALFGKASELLSGLDVVVNNAGLGHTADVVETSDEDWHRVIDVSLKGCFRCTRAALRVVAPGGAIVNIGSVTADRAERGQAAYAAAKAGVHALTRCAAVEAAERSVRVNAISPTLASNPFVEKVADPEHLAAMTALQPQGRAAQSEEIAMAVLFLASDLSSYLTGECLSVSGQKA